MSNWQPIKTAPRSGIEILATNGTSVEIVSWHKGWPGKWRDRYYEPFPASAWQELPLPGGPPA